MYSSLYIKRILLFFLLILPQYIYCQTWDRSGNSITSADYLGVTNGFDLVFKTTPLQGTLTERLRLTENGRIGIGIATPTGAWSPYVLHMQSPFPEFRISNENDSTSFSFFASGNSYLHSNRSFILLLDSGEQNFFTVARRNNNSIQPGDHTELMKLGQDGILYVQGLKVTVDSFPDYVFHSSYQLMPLKELKEYIKKESHLPGIPRAANVSENGLDVGLTQKLMMQKIEELTLYIISLQEQIEELRAVIKERK
jgi:hypothetical protein